VGILVGLFMMWLVFDRLWGTSAVIEMKNSFVSTVSTDGPIGKRTGFEGPGD
jgi:hypothetical protein